MITGAIRMVDEYSTADIMGRINIILLNYTNFPEIVEGYEESLKFLIVNERRMHRRKAVGELGIRIQTSGNSDTTADAAIESVMLTEAIRSGNMRKELKDIECSDQYQHEADVLKNMREDYELVKSQIKTLPWDEHKVLDSYLTGKNNLVNLSSAADCSYDAMKNKLKRARNKVKRTTAFYLERKYRTA